MEAKRRALKRKPLSDCTNTITTRSSSTSLIKPSKFLPSTFTNPESKQFSTSSNIESVTSVGSNNDNTTTTNNNKNGLNPRSIPSLPSTPLRLPNPSSTDPGLGKPITDYTRRPAAEKRKEKGKMVVDPSSCPPVERIRNFRGGVGDVGLSKSCIIPRKKKQRRLPLEKDEHALPQDYIEQQRAYFAEIDAFKLPEEVVSESELE